jgi:MFS family permease
MMWPAILGLFYAILPASRAALAGGIIIGVAGIGNAAGPLVGGFLTQEVSWRWIFALNVPIAAIACLVTWRSVHVANPDEHSHVDYVGIVTLSFGLIALLVALGQAPDEGWTSPLVLGLLAVSATLLVGFGMRERSAGEDGLVPPSIMANRAFTSVCAAVLLMAVTFFAVLFYLPQFFQKVLDADALESGLGMLPMLGTFALASFLEGALVARVGLKAVITVGAACLAAGTFLLLALVDQSSGYGSFVPGMVVLGVGVGLFYSSVTTAGVTALDPSQSSLAGGILYMCQVAGGALGLGISTTVFLAGMNRGMDRGASEMGIDLTGDEIEAVRGVVAGTDSSSAAVGRFPAAQAAELTDVVRDSFVTGLRWTLVLIGILALGGLAVSVLAAGGPISRFGRDVGEP